MDSPQVAQDSAVWRLSLRQILKHPLPYQADERITRLICRTFYAFTNRRLLAVEGDLSQLCPEHDPYVVIINHNQKHESILIPAWMLFVRQGKPIHFLADWNYLLMPFVASLYRRSQTIIVTRKRAKPGFLNVFKPLFRQKVPAFERALERLRRGSPVGIFPEGTINRHPTRLMRGLPGAAKLALQAQVPVLPIGIRFPQHPTDQPISDRSAMALHIGNFIQPPSLADGNAPSRAEISDFHAQIMNQLATVSGKTWHAQANKRRKYVF